MKLNYLSNLINRSSGEKIEVFQGACEIKPQINSFTFSNKRF